MQRSDELARLLDRLKTEPLGPKSFSLPELVAMPQWQSRLSDHFILHYYDDTGSESHLPDTLLIAFERLYTELMACMQIVPRTKQELTVCGMKLTCFVVRTPSPRTFGSIESPGVLFYLLDPQQDPQYLSKFRHEIAHLVWGRSYGEAPPLFNEGVAVYAETVSDPESEPGQTLRILTDTLDAVPSLTELADTDRFWDEYGRGLPAYRISASWVHYLILRWGWQKLATLFLESNYVDPDISTRFRSIYGQDLASVETAWHWWLAQW